jgi:hypothetical protein
VFILQTSYEGLGVQRSAVKEMWIANIFATCVLRELLIRSKISAARLVDVDLKMKG